MVRIHSGVLASQQSLSTFIHIYARVVFSASRDQRFRLRRARRSFIQWSLSVRQLVRAQIPVRYCFGAAMRYPNCRVQNHLETFRMQFQDRRFYSFGTILVLVAAAFGCDQGTTVDQGQSSSPSPKVMTSGTDSKASAPEASESNAPITIIDSPESATVSSEKKSDPIQTVTNTPLPTLETKQATAKLHLRMFSWNVESEGADSDVIASQLKEMGEYDVYALSEVMPEDLRKYKNTLGDNFKFAHSSTGFNDRLQILYNAQRFETIQKLDLDEINYERRYRSPLVVHLRDKETQIEFMVMNNHLARGKAEIRTKQAEQLVEWARGKTIPIIALGDYNYDFVFATETGNEGFKAMLRDNVWRWVRPTELIDTNWFDPEPDGIDNFPGSMLDFAFVAGKATEWTCVCNIIVREGDFPDDNRTSDHRPYELKITQ